MTMATHTNFDDGVFNSAPNLLVKDHCNECEADIDKSIHGIQHCQCKYWFHAIGCNDDFVVS